MIWELAWKLGKPLLPYVGAALAIGAVVWMIYSAGASSRDAEVRDAQDRATTAEADAQRAEYWRQWMQDQWSASEAQARQTAQALAKDQEDSQARQERIAALGRSGALSDCHLPDAAVRLWNDAYSGWPGDAGGGGRTGDAAMPTPATADDGGR